jgi:drug/metabolite transporter (DMT)-like permease
MQSLAYLLILLSATIHASWNVLARHLKGNTPALVIAHFIGSVMLFPFTFLESKPFSSFSQTNVLLLLGLSLLAHGGYVLLLSSAYVHGDVGLVYPLARGTAIILATIVSQMLNIDDRLSAVAICGIVVVIVGILALCCDAILKAEHTHSSYKEFSAIDNVVTESVNIHETELVVGTVKTCAGNEDFRNGESKNAHECNNKNSDDSVRINTEDVQEAMHNILNPIHEQLASSRDDDAVILGVHDTSAKSNETCHDNNLDSGGSSQLVESVPPNILYTIYYTALEYCFPGSKEWFVKREKMFVSIVLAMGVGCCTATYSIVDSVGVSLSPPLSWAFMYNFISNPLLMPFMYKFYSEDTVTAVTKHKKSMILIAPCVVGAYLIILFVFTMPGVDVALVVTLREFAVLIGSFLGVVLLKEHFSWVKFSAIICMLIGMLILKFA